MAYSQGQERRSEDWLTPPDLLAALGSFDLDPCAAVDQPWKTAYTQWTIQDDAWWEPWFGRVWLNPPYGRKTAVWVRRLAEHGNGIALIFARTETRLWFSEIWFDADAVLFLRGRLRFHRPDGTLGKTTAGAPSALVAYGPSNAEALLTSELHGVYVPLLENVTRTGGHDHG